MNIVNLNYHIIIPARGGSKRFPKKNIHLLDGIPLISHSIKFALETFPHKNIWVNTDDHEIAKIGLSFGVNVTMRPDNLGSDTASTADVLYYQQEIFDSKQINCEAMILLQVTNPLRPRKLILDAILAFEKNKRTSLATFTKLNRKFGKIKSGYYFPENYIPGQRMQDIEPEYFENGLIYIVKKQAIKEKVIITQDVYPLVINTIESLVDIDEPEDIKFAEYLIIKNNQKNESIY